MTFTRVKAIHPHWTGVVMLSTTDNTVSHDGHGSRGTYTLVDDRLTIYWNDYQPDSFTKLFDWYVHDQIRPIHINEMIFLKIGDRVLKTRSVSVLIENSDYAVNLRPQTSDGPTFQQVFVDFDYDSPNLPSSADVVVDLGANIGLATVFFGLRYPNAKILAVEPDRENFDVMVSNTVALGDRVMPLHAAAWSDDGVINLLTETEDGAVLDAWGIQVSARAGRASKTVNCHTIKTLLENAGLSSVDILKIDIEGAELEVFSSQASAWLSKVTLIIVETHDRFRPGSEAAVREAVHPMFEELPRRGENLFFRRRIPTA